MAHRQHLDPGRRRRTARTRRRVGWQHRVGACAVPRGRPGAVNGPGQARGRSLRTAAVGVSSRTQPCDARRNSIVEHDQNSDGSCTASPSVQGTALVSAEIRRYGIDMDDRPESGQETPGATCAEQTYARGTHIDDLRSRTCSVE
jgi:hypothetical protein